MTKVGDGAFRAAITAARRQGLDSTDAVLLRATARTTVLLPTARVVIRAACGASREVLVREFDVARLLVDAGAPVLPPYHGTEPVQVGAYTATFWPQATREPSLGWKALGRTLHGLHAVHLRRKLGGPDADWNALTRQAEPIVPGDILRSCLEQFERLREPISTAPVVLHGDAHVRNLLALGGQPALVDLETICRGDWWLDLVAAYVEEKRFGLGDFAQFVSGYGERPPRGEGWQRAVRRRELTIALWLAVHGKGPRAQAEATARLEDVTGQANRPRWRLVRLDA